MNAESGESEVNTDDADRPDRAESTESTVNTDDADRAESTENFVSSEPVANEEPAQASDEGGGARNEEGGRSTDFWKDRNDVRRELDDEMKMVLKRIREVYAKDEIVEVPSLKARERRKVNNEVKIVNGVIHNVEVKTVTEVNKLLYAGSVVVAERLGLMKVRKEAKNKKNEPWWKRRIEKSIVKWKADLSRVEVVLKGNGVSRKVRERLDTLYQLNVRGALGVSTFLRSKIQAGCNKVKRYVERSVQFHQNNLFKNNQSNLYKELSGSEMGNNPTPNAAEATEFWRGIWSVSGEYEREATWIEDVKTKMRGKTRQENVSVSVEDVVAGVRKMPCWKAPGPDGVRGFWFKKLFNLHQCMAESLQECLDNGNVPEWMVRGRTVLVQKDPAEGTAASNYRPLACLPLMWKLLSGVFAARTYEHLKDNALLPSEQKGCRKQSRGTKDQLVIDKAVMSLAKSRNVAMAWVDYKKAYDMVPHSWILKVSDLLGVAQNVRGLMENSMPMWKTDLNVNGEVLGTVDIYKGIFQGDSFSPLLFVMIMIPLSMILRDMPQGFKYGSRGELINHLLFMDDLKLYASNEEDMEVLVSEVESYSRDIGMEFGMKKCATLVVKKGVRVSRTGVTLPNGEVMKDVSEEGYKYLGVLQNEQVMNDEMIGKVSDEYLRRVKLLARSKLNAGNMIAGVNCWAIGVMRYSAGIVEWSKDQLEFLDGKTRKILNMNGAFKRTSGVNRLYMKRKDGGRGLISVLNCVEMEKRSLSEYVRTSDEWMLKRAAELGMVTVTESKNEYKARVEREKKEGAESMVRFGKFYRDTKELAHERTNEWLKSGHMGKATEAYIIAAQERALHTRSRRARIYGEDVDPKCRVCGLYEETVMHVASGCEELAKKQYKIRHDGMGKRVHWELCKKYDVECSERWYEHVPFEVCRSRGGRVEIYWDKKIATAKSIEHCKPDVIVVDKEANKWTIIDFSVPMDVNVAKKEIEKRTRYAELATEIRKIYRVTTDIVPIIIGALGTVPLLLPGYVKQLGIPDNVIGGMQVSALLGTVRILKNILCL